MKKYIVLWVVLFVALYSCITYLSLVKIDAAEGFLVYNLKNNWIPKALASAMLSSGFCVLIKKIKR